ncbi:hypothetical protein Xcel_3031 [Xylanimonas cellulosilytica DSM 15894]|uniref:DUF4395 domain-containing protein n=1 Tax=Xylanimonas cellulosilytica (strain DSM 15894 / JCM 12276 / CECT 5975 / KCTC 9989 / LMG 20990 / NBRC 107835 / XIL07) TaxID=446471 RepID=D1BZQ9_XYLCX|nr:DUF4395 domain-containing protein [Xylanimonas cellulosilytica]ACZ32037.1 hypothetical protein Xcel_3031 [Xylanimonas cellulosilytica DSM 15894]
MTTSSSTGTTTPAGIDPRGPRVAAGITAVLLAVVVLLGVGESTRTAALVLLIVLALSFAVGAVLGAQGTWQGWVYRTFVRPRLAPPAELEDPRPPRFAQLVGLLVTGVGVVLGLAGVELAVPIAAAFAFVAAALNAVVGLCLGCELYLLGRRLRPSGGAAA